MFDEWCELNGNRDNLEHLLERLGALHQKAVRSLAELNRPSGRPQSEPVSREGQSDEVPGQ